MTIADVVKFIRENDIDHEHWSDEQIATLISRAIKNNAFLYTTNEENKLAGILVGEWIDEKTFKIVSIVGKGQLIKLIKHFKSLFPKVEKVVGNRHRPKEGTTKKVYEEQKFEFREYLRSKTPLV